MKKLYPYSLAKNPDIIAKLTKLINDTLDSMVDVDGEYYDSHKMGLITATEALMEELGETSCNGKVAYVSGEYYPILKMVA